MDSPGARTPKAPPRQPLAADTPLEIEAIMVDRWRRMTPEDKTHLASAMSRTVHRLAEAGVRQRHPHADDREVFLRLAIVRLGYALAVAAFPDADGLTA